MANHIEKRLLNTNVRYRFDYIAKFLNFTVDDIAVLNNFAKIAHPHIQTLVEVIYHKLFEYDITKEYFIKQNFVFKGVKTTDNNQLTLQSEQMLFRIDSIRKYLYRILRQHIWNDAFLQYLSTIGKMHTNLAGAHSIDIDYIHINAMLGYLQHTFIEIILSSEELDDAMKKTTLLALNKLFWIQNDFFSMHYIVTPHDGN
ncbi:unnamed protein product [Rotaria magnacalcarata]|uniref:Globin-sensor domain-containing protein n=1 Tax=Rotaria magnacalcarata TaxID=392030 RepID=A0A816YE52_9BILA|nr:unnamed protein product [Rotaria magnacalcarata]CAF1598512.1 unnamed protein product [Rotaria magnacalcarata]CAF2128519.1 unnamed protein product [Rotaria magnacalcarata]CAF2145310.1 unnamed protein product [Rotaria magnacalcarata]CAF2157593.1 unnamed protein product [Rotaria magnacalcarata]